MPSVPSVASARVAGAPQRAVDVEGLRRLRRRQRQWDRKAVSFVAPALLILVVFVLYPTLYALGISFTNASGFNVPELVGLDNYVRIFTSADTLRAIGNTLWYVVLYMPATIACALAVAMLLNRSDLVMRGMMRTVIFVPFIISMAVAALAWGFIVDPHIGILPYWLSRVGIHVPDLLSSPTWAMPTVVLVAVWKNFGYFMVIFLAGLQNVPRELYEAASIDGAGSWRRFLSVTLPGLRPTMTYVVVLVANGAFQAFDQIYIMTKGGPMRTTETVVYRVYSEGFTNFKMGEASALSFILMGLTLVVGVAQLVVSRRQERDM